MALGYVEEKRYDAPYGIFIEKFQYGYIYIEYEDGTNCDYHTLIPGDVFTVAGQESIEVEVVGNYYPHGLIFTTNGTGTLDQASATRSQINYVTTRNYDDIPAGEISAYSYPSTSSSSLDVSYSGSELTNGQVIKHLMGKALKVDGHEALLTFQECRDMGSYFTLYLKGSLNFGDLGFTKSISTGTLINGYATDHEIKQIKDTLFVSAVGSTYISVDTSSTIYTAKAIADSFIRPFEQFYIGGLGASVLTVVKDISTFIYPNENLSGYSISQGSYLSFGEPSAQPVALTVPDPINNSNVLAAIITGTVASHADGEWVSITADDTASGSTNTVTAIGIDGSFSAELYLVDLLDGTVTFTAAHLASDGITEISSATATSNKLVDPAITISVSIPTVDALNESAVVVSGSTTGLSTASPITIYISDSATGAVQGSTTTASDGSFSSTFSLADFANGDILVTANHSDYPELVSQSVTTKNTALPSALTLSAIADITTSNESAVPVSGTATNLPDATAISITATDTALASVTGSALTLADGSYSTTLDVSTLADGDITFEAKVVDETATEQLASVVVVKDTSFIEHVRDGAPAYGDFVVGGFYSSDRIQALRSVSSVNIPHRTFLPGDVYVIEGQENIEFELYGSNENYLHLYPSSMAGLGIDQALADGKNLIYKRTKKYPNADSHNLQIVQSVYDLKVSFEKMSYKEAVQSIMGKHIKIDDGVNQLLTHITSTGAPIGGNEFLIDLIRRVDIPQTFIPGSWTRFSGFASDNEVNAIRNTLSPAYMGQGFIEVTSSSTTYSPDEIIAKFVKPGDTFYITLDDGSVVLTDQLVSVFRTYSDRIVINEDISTYSLAPSTLLNFGEDTLLSATLTANAGAIDSLNETAAPVSGTFTNLEPGTLVKLKSTDSAGVSVMGYNSVQEDGTYSGTIDVSSLNSGTITYEASVVDQKWDIVTATTTAQKSSVTVGTLTIDAIDDITTENAGSYTITGVTTGLPMGEVITVTITDSAGGTLTSTGEVVSGGGFSALFDANSLENGAATAEATATDQNATTLSQTDSMTVDVIPAGSMSMDLLTDIDYQNVAAYVVSGSSGDLPEGTEITIQLADASAGTLSAIALVGATGGWSHEFNASSLSDGSVTVTASAVDQRGDTVSVSAVKQKDARLPGTLTITGTPALIDKSNVNTVAISGETTNTPENNVVNVEVGDGTNTLFATASVQPDGTWSVSMDVETLDDAMLTITADVDDQLGEVKSDSVQVEKDSLYPGSITLTIGSTSDISSVNVSGGTTYTPTGSTVDIEVTDGSATVHNFTATTDVNGDYQTTLDLSPIAGGIFTVVASVTDETGAVVQDSATAQKTVAVEQGGAIYLSGEEIGKANVTSVSVTGDSSNVPSGQSVSITAQDEALGTVSTTATIGADGSYSATFDATMLADGTITLTATTTDEIGDTISVTAQVQKDALHPGTITLTAPAAGKDNVEALPATGSTTNVPTGSTVGITATDTDGAISSTDATVASDGTFTVELNLAGLDDGEIYIVASVEDETGATISGNATIEKDSLHPGTISISADPITKDNVREVNVFGDLLNVPPGSAVLVNAEDISGFQIAATVDSDALGYQMVMDLFDLADGKVTLKASVIDETGATIQATTTTSKDALYPGTIDASMVEITYQNYNSVQISGQTVNVPAGEDVIIEAADSAGNTYADTATIQDDGSYIRKLDLTTLADGDINVSVSVMDETGEMVVHTFTVNKETESEDDFTLLNLQMHYGTSFPKGITESQFKATKTHTLNYVKTFVIAAKEDFDKEAYAYLKEAIWDIAHYKLWLNVGTPSEGVTKKKEEAVDWLRDIVKGNVRIKTPDKETRKKGMHTIKLWR